MERLAARLEHSLVAAGTTVVEEGEAGDRFYLVASGEIDVIHGGSRVNTLVAGDYFGEIALLATYRALRPAQRTDAEIYSLSRDVFIAAVSGDMRSSTTARECDGQAPP